MMKTYDTQLNVLIHVLEDDETIIDRLKELFRMNGFIDVFFFTESDVFLENFTQKVHVCVIDYYLDGPFNGVDITKIVLSQNPMCKVIMITGAEDRKIFQSFHNEGGFRSVCKHDQDANQQIVTHMQAAISVVRSQVELWMDLLKDHHKKEMQ